MVRHRRVVALTFVLAALWSAQRQAEAASDGRYTFSTLAGLPATGSADGTGHATQFANPQGVAIDSAGNIYVANTSNHTIRKITQAGVVTTLAGTAGSAGSTDATAARHAGVRRFLVILLGSSPAEARVVITTARAVSTVLVVVAHRNHRD